MTRVVGSKSSARKMGTHEQERAEREMERERWRKNRRDGRM